MVKRRPQSSATVVVLPRSPRRSPKGANAATIYETVRRAIIEQALTPGAKLPEDAIGASFGVSRTIAREALHKLAESGLVEIRRNLGARVARPSWEEARDIFDIRMALECIVVERLAGRLTPAQVRRLEDHAEAEERAAGGQEPRSVRLATEFHVLLAEMTGSDALVRYVAEVAWRCGFTLTLYSRPHSSECGVSEHREIIAALVAGDAARAMGVMEHHLRGVVDRALIGPSTRSVDLGEILQRFRE